MSEKTDNEFEIKELLKQNIIMELIEKYNTKKEYWTHHILYGKKSSKLELLILEWGSRGWSYKFFKIDEIIK